jgi:hypothetical protein
VQLELRQDDEAGFGRVRGRLLDGFGGWLKAQPGLDEAAADDATVDAGIALEWKFAYGDGHLGRWTTSDVAEFLLSWCPRKLSVSQADSVTIPGSIAAFTDYLAAERLLAPGSASPARLRAAATGAASEFVAAMGDPANFGMAKSIFSGALADGADPSDPAQLEQWVTRFNSLSDEERKAVLPDNAFSTGGAADRSAQSSMALPPVPLPPPEAVQASEAAAPVLRMFADLAGFDPGDRDSFAQVLFQRLVTTGPAGMLGTLALAGDDEEQARLATELGRSPAPPAESVLEAIGAHHPVRPVAKAARKALFLRCSRAAARHR